MEIGSRVTVMRDGCFVGTRDVATLQLQELITMMVGRKIEDVYNRTYLEPGIERLRTTKLTGLRFRNVDLCVHANEVVGLAGLVGAGRTEVAKAIFGYDPIDSGCLVVNGKEIPVARHSPNRAFAAAWPFLPENRKEEGLFLPKTIRENITQVILPKALPPRHRSAAKGGLTDQRTNQSPADHDNLR